MFSTLNSKLQIAKATNNNVFHKIDDETNVDKSYTSTKSNTNNPPNNKYEL